MASQQNNGIKEVAFDSISKVTALADSLINIATQLEKANKDVDTLTKERDELKIEKKKVSDELKLLKAKIKKEPK